ncbi:PREDICTED: uncharacterized protein LOC108375804 [Rhagoletis zephyria]|uniref:uncharacterized protein LOC108375804 n=1 Tax=Rhagoletis zephyria TaxID=28612 RepID=UPI0008114CB8|nr:PREDICTED: uncharacterized protein LOC108375804 [Rhagoletis zephyria]
MENKGKLTLQCSPGTFQKVQNDTDRNKVVQDAAGDDFYEEIEISQYSALATAPGVIGDSDYIPICPPVGTNKGPVSAGTDECMTDFATDSEAIDNADKGGEEPLSFEPGCSKETPDQKTTWLDAPTKFLISRVKELRPKVGKSAKLRKKRQMWMQISNELRDKGYTFSWPQVETKFFSLERQYKKAQLHNSKTGRNR